MRILTLRECTNQQQWQDICSWVTDHGGYVHPALTLVDNAECGSRGVIATAPGISMQELTKAPLVAVPEKLYMTSDAALQLLQSQPHARTTPAPHATQQLFGGAWKWPGITSASSTDECDSLTPATQLALLLAHERAKGQNSFWWPYIQTLPTTPPCAWHASNSAALNTELKALLGSDRATQVRLVEVKAGIDRQVQAAVQVHGKQLEVAASDVEWALAQVRQRLQHLGYTWAGRYKLHRLRCLRKDGACHALGAQKG